MFQSKKVSPVLAAPELEDSRVCESVCLNFSFYVNIIQWETGSAPVQSRDKAEMSPCHAVLFHNINI